MGALKASPGINSEKPAVGLPKVLAIVAGLWAFSVVQPLFDLLARNPQFLGVHDIGGGGLLTLLAILMIPVPLLLALLISLGYKLDSRIGLFLLGATGVVLVTAGLRPILGRLIPMPGWWQLALATGTALFLCLAAGKISGIARQLPWLAIFPFLFSAVFLFQPGPRSILFPPASAPIDAPGSPSSPQADSQTPVVLVVFDAFPTVSLMDEDMGIDASLCPNLAAFAEDAVWYRNTLAVSPATVWAVPAIMAGKYSLPMSSPNIAWYPDNIFSWLAPTHRIQAFESHTLLDPFASRRPSFKDRMELTISDLWIIYQHVLLPKDLAAGVPVVTNDWKGFAQGKEGGHTAFPDRQQLAEEFMASFADSLRPGCYFLHALVPHGPTQFLPSGHRYTKENDPPSGLGNQWGNWSDDLWTVINGQQRHLLQVGYADHLAGRIIGRLKEAGLYEKSVVVFCADHGMGFTPGDARRALSNTNQGDILPVPFLIKFPGTGQGSIDDRPALTIDILPTIAGALGTALTWVDGQNLASNSARQLTDLEFLQEEGPGTAIIDTVLAQRRASLAIKHRRFGPSPGSPQLFAPLRGSILLGQQVPDDLPGFPDVLVSLKRTGPWISPDPTNGMIPVEVTGFVQSRDSLATHLDLAVSVDGYIRAVFRPFGRTHGSDLAVFSTMLPETCMDPGEHRLGILIVDWSEGGPRIFSTDEGTSKGFGLNLVGNPYQRLKTSGLYDMSSWDGIPTMWTNGFASFILPNSGGSSPTSIQLGLAPVGVSDTPLVVVVNGAPVLSELVGPGPWDGHISLDNLEYSREIRIGIFSGSFVPSETLPNSRDNRVLGVPVQILKLDTSHDSGSWVKQTIPSLTIRPRKNGPIAMTGIFAPEDWKGEPAAWTGGLADLLAPWDGEEFPTRLFLSLADSGPRGRDFSIFVNEHLVFSEELDGGPLLEMIDLAGVPRETPLRIRMTCETFSPKDHDSDTSDQRQLGVALRLLTLF